MSATRDLLRTSDSPVCIIKGGDGDEEWGAVPAAVIRRADGGVTLLGESEESGASAGLFFVRPRPDEY